MRFAQGGREIECGRATLVLADGRRLEVEYAMPAEDVGLAVRDTEGCVRLVPWPQVAELVMEGKP